MGVGAWDRLAPSYLSRAELLELGLAAVGEDVQISRDARIYGASRVSIGSHVRIDDFTVITAPVEPVVIGSHVHIHTRVGLYGQAGIVIEDYAGLSGGVMLYTASDDYSGRAMTNPTVPDHLRRVTVAPIHVGRHGIVGAGAILLPGASLGEGAAVGALSLVTRPVPPWTIVSGVPARRLKDRRRDLLDLEREL